jgi:phage FluMu protein Com
MATATLNQLLKFPCPHCQDVRRVSVESETATVILPRICPMRRSCESEVLRAYYLTMGEPKC